MKAAVRRAISSTLREKKDGAECSRKIFDIIKKTDIYTTAKKIAVFLSMPTEPDTEPLIKDAFAAHKKVYAPRMYENDLIFAEIAENSVTKTGAFGVQEPIGDGYFGDFDVVFVPLVAFDEQKNRLGHGKGYYDRFLARTKAITIGLAFECQKINIVPCEEHDIPLSYIITEKKIY